MGGVKKSLIIVVLNIISFVLLSNAAEFGPRYYVQDSLIMMLDAEFNSTNEFGEMIHDASATKWIDLSGNGYDFTKNSGGSWAAKHFNFGVGKKLAATGVKELPWYFTQEVVCTPTSTTGRFIFMGKSSAECIVQGVVTVSGYTNLFQTSFLRPTKGVTRWINAQAAEQAPFTLTSLYSESISSGQKESYVSGVGPSSSYAAENQWNKVPVLPLIGARNADHGNYGVGKLYSIRLYSRELTQEEILRNSAIDDVRFRGKALPMPLEPAVSGSQVLGGLAGTALIKMTASSYGYFGTKIESAYLEYSADGTFEDIISLPFRKECGGVAQCIVQGLNAGEVYQARIVATNEFGAGVTSENFSFTASSAENQPSVDIVSVKPGDYYVDVTAILHSADSSEILFGAYLADHISVSAGSVSVSALPGTEFTVRINALSAEKKYVLIPSLVGGEAAAVNVPFETLKSCDEVRRGRNIEIAPDLLDATKIVATFEAPGRESQLYLLADGVDRGTGEWAYTQKVCNVSADATSCSISLPEGWGSKYYALRCFIGEEGSALLAGSQRYKTDKGVKMFAQWDAIDNTDVDVYSSAPSQWNDLVRGMPMINASTYTADGSVTNVYNPSKSALSVSWGLPRIFIERGTFTIETFLKPTQFTSQGGLVMFGSRLLSLDMRTNTGNALKFAIQYRCKDWPSGAYSIENAATLNKYQHFAMVCDGGTVRTYVDGNLIHTGASGGAEGSDQILFGKYGNTIVRNRYCSIRLYDGPLSLETLAANRELDSGRFTHEVEIAPSPIAMSAIAYHYVSSSAPSLQEAAVSGLETGDSVVLSGAFSGDAKEVAVSWWTEGATSTQTVAAVIDGSSYSATLYPTAPGVNNFYKITASSGSLSDVREGSFVPYGQVVVSVSGPNLSSSTISYTVRVTEQGAGDTYAWVRRGLTADTLEDLGAVVKINSGDMGTKTISAKSPVFGQAYYYAVVISNSCSNAENGSWAVNRGVSRQTVIDEATYTHAANGLWSSASTWSMSGAGQGYPSGSSEIVWSSSLKTVLVDGIYSLSTINASSGRSVVLTGVVENASITCDIKGSGNGLHDLSWTLIDVAISELNGVSMNGGNNSGRNTLSFRGNTKYTSGGGFTMASASSSLPVTINVADYSLVNLGKAIDFSGAGVFNINLSGPAPKIRASKVGEASSTEQIKGSFSINYNIPSEIAAEGYADTPIRTSSTSASSALGYFADTQAPSGLSINIDSESSVLTNIHSAVDFVLAEACAGIITNNIKLAESVGKVMLDWRWKYGWDTESGKSLFLAAPETEGDKPTALSLRFYRPGLTIFIR